MKIVSYKCDCSKTDAHGNNCEIRYDQCNSNPCQNEGTCLDKVSDYSLILREYLYE